MPEFYGNVLSRSPNQYGKLTPIVAEMGWMHNLVIIKSRENPAIGIILCKSKKRAIVEYALRESNKAIRVATQMVSTVPPKLWGQLPEPEQVAMLLENVV